MAGEETADAGVEVEARVLLVKRHSKDMLYIKCVTTFVADAHHIAVGTTCRLHAYASDGLPLDDIVEQWVAAEAKSSSSGGGDRDVGDRDGDGGGGGSVDVGDETKAGATSMASAADDDDAAAAEAAAAAAAEAAAAAAVNARNQAIANRQSVKGDRRRRAQERAAVREERERGALDAHAPGKNTMVRSAGTSVLRLRTRAGDVVSEYNRKGEVWYGRCRAVPCRATVSIVTSSTM